MLVLAIDPSSNNIGYAAFMIRQDGVHLSHSSTFKTKGENELQKCQYIAHRLSDFITEDSETMHFRHVVIERPFIPPQVNNNMVRPLMVSIGAVCAAFSDSRLHYCSGHKTKKKAAFVLEKYNIETRTSEHQRDALSLGDYWIHKHLRLQEAGCEEFSRVLSSIPPQAP